ncbi:MAG: transposase [Planctomycetes bacterium]|nr:transposase [Planctomycetota bacterium]MBI3845295.1 transposase [Planctomycetota bacterium]
MAAHDLFRGLARALRFDANAARGEIPHATELLDQVPPGTLSITDRGFTFPQFFKELSERNVYGLCRMKKGLKVCKVEALPKRQLLGGPLEDRLVDVGSGQKTPAQRLRLITWRCGKDVFKLLTNVLDTTKLSAEVALDLYRKRWSVERMYFDLKEVFNLNQFYASNPNGVAMQVYAAAIVDVAMRVAQGRSAQHAHVEPEDISTAKFFPRMATAYATHSGFGVVYRATCDVNPGVELTKPDPTGHLRFTVKLKDILVHPRSGVRRKRRYCEGRKKWKSFAHIPGAKTLMKLS